MVWFLYFPLMILMMLFCYITNPIVVLFADEEGELHGIWHLWQTWDDSLDSKFFMTEVIPKSRFCSFLNYGWANKYRPYQEKISEYNWTIDKVTLLPIARFSFIERLQRYACRVLWLTRNCGYGFAMNCFGAKGYSENIEMTKDDNYGKTGELRFAWDKEQPLWKRPWTLKFYKHIAGSFYITGYLGWKIPVWNKQGVYRCMIANRIALRFHPQEA